MDFSSPTECSIGHIRARSKVFSLKGLYSGVNTISHYSNLEGLCGIIESGGFWLSDHRFLNDTEEFENGRSLAIKLLQNLVATTQQTNFASILNEALSCLENHREKPYFVCSFSKNADSLVLWRSYTNNGQGISITFDTNTRHLDSHFEVLFDISLNKVIYDESEKIELLHQTIRAHEEEHSLDEKHENEINIDNWGKSLAEDLAFDFIKFKHPDYSSEQEIRMVASSATSAYLQHRVGNERIIPYILSSDIYKNNKYLKTDKLPITEIRIGPTFNQDMTVKSIKAYLTNKGYDTVKVLKSDVPYRG